MIRPEVCTKNGIPIVGKATFEEHVEYEAANEYNRCIYFNGMRNTQCDAGITYWPKGPQPCWRDTTSPHVCPAQQFPTEDEALCMARERMAAISAALWQFTERQHNRQCVQCGAAYTRLHQSGPCVYAVPCGHRQWQGTIPKEEPAGL